MPKKREWDWDDVGVGRAYRKTWDELGISPTQFKIFKEASHRHFTTGKKSESDRVCNLLQAGHSLKSLVALADQDIKESSCLFGCLLELTEKKGSNPRGSLQQIRSYLLHLPFCFDERDVLNWMQLLSPDELKLLKDAGFINEGDDSEFKMVASALEQLRTNIKWLPAALVRLLAELPERFDMDDIESAIQAHELKQLAYFHIQQSNLERESAEFKSGKYGDWRSLGISIDEMYEIVNSFYEPVEEAEHLVSSFYADGNSNALFEDFKNLAQNGLGAHEILELIRGGVTAADTFGLKSAGLRITRDNLNEWSSVEGKVILFCIDNVITKDDRGWRFEDWMPSADLVLPWWEFCRDQGWLGRYSKSQLLNGIDFEDAAPDQLMETTSGEHEVELLSLWDYFCWIQYSGLKGKFAEIQDWRRRGFVIVERDFKPDFAGRDGLDPDDAHAWKFFKFSPKQASEWSSIELSPGRPARLSPKSAALWRGAKIKPHEVKAWYAHGIDDPIEAAAWVISGASPQVAQTRKRAGVNPPRPSSLI
jgi:hypothetical protein